MITFLHLGALEYMHGNTLKDSDGCILVGDMIDYNFKLYNSKKALDRLLQVIRENEICQIIIV